MNGYERLHLAKRTLLARMPDEGAPGVTAYRVSGEAPSFEGCALEGDDASKLAEIAAASETGSVLLADDTRWMLVLPAFAVRESSDYGEVHARPLIAVLERPRVYAALLLRLGGFSVGFFRGESIVEDKTDQRFVKNRNRKGGQSQRRFERIREKQIYELFGKACTTSREHLTPYESEIEHVFFGGDRHTLQAFRKECTYFERFGDRVAARVLPVAGDPRRASLDAVPREVWSSEVYVAAATTP